MTAEKAIERSISHNEIVTIHANNRADYDSLCSALSSESDDDVEHATSEGDIHEYWGEIDGDDWRVHVRLALVRASGPDHSDPDPITGGYIRYTDGTVEPCDHLNGTHRDGSCVDCGYC